jgi:hypothetical protein
MTVFGALCRGGRLGDQTDAGADQRGWEDTGVVQEAGVASARERELVDWASSCVYGVERYGRERPQRSGQMITLEWSDYDDC